MLHIYRLKNNRLTPVITQDAEQAKQAIWIDCIAPTAKERQYIETTFKQSLAKPSELGDIEASARFFEDETGLHLQSFYFYEDRNEHAISSTVAFTLQDGRLFSYREKELSAFRLYRMRARTQTFTDLSAHELCLDLLATKIEQLADEIETLYGELETLSRIILEGKRTEEFDASLQSLAGLEDTSSKTRLCLMDTQRALNFLLRKGRLPSGCEREQAQDILRDIESLLPHNESLFQRINFLLQAAMGFMELSLSNTMKLFSAVSLISIIPSLIATWYGMDSVQMPEKGLACFYPILITITTSLVGLAFFWIKRKGWL